MQPETKSPFASKTLWFNVLAAGAALFGADGTFGHVFAPEEVAAVLGIGNIALRLVTSKGILK